MTVKLLAHRGLWRERSEQNSFVALARALDAGYGIETDVRDHHQDIVISHDPPSGQSWPLVSLLEYYETSRSQAWLALNIKADGLANSLTEILSQFPIRNYFVFDMSVPDSLAYIRHHQPFFTRHSEWEPQPVMYASAVGVWLDSFESQWYQAADIERHLDAGKHVAVVSPELHGRSFESTWQLIAELKLQASSEVMLCTDHPQEFEQRQGT